MEWWVAIGYVNGDVLCPLKNGKLVSRKPVLFSPNPSGDAPGYGCEVIANDVVENPKVKEPTS